MSRPLATSAIALLLGAGPGLAEVTPAQVWENLRQSYEDMGYEVQVGAENASGDGLTLTDVTLTSAADAESDFTFVMPSLVMTPTGGGDVRSVIEGQMSLEMNRTTPEGEDVGFAMTMDAPGNETVTSGTPEEMQHRFVVPTMTLTGRALDEVNETPVTATLTNVQGSQTVVRTVEGGSNGTYNATADEVQVQIDASGPALALPEDQEATDSFAATVQVADLALTGTVAAPAEDADFGTRPAAALAAGYDANGTLRMGELSIDFQSSTRTEDGGTENSSGTIGAAATELAAAIAADGLSYSGSLSDMTTRLTSDGMAVPLAYAAEHNAFSLKVPVTAAETEQPFSLSYVLGGLTLDEALWQAFDADATLPREPANFTIDLEGQAVLTRNLMEAEAPAATAEDARPMPFQPRSLTLRDVSLDALGASADLSGSLAFGDDPSQPTGTISGTFSGINGLLDKLAAVGIVPQDQLMAPRMMIAMFARPVEGNPDQLQTELEFREDGSIFANGQQVQ